MLVLPFNLRLVSQLPQSYSSKKALQKSGNSISQPHSDSQGQKQHQVFFQEPIRLGLGIAESASDGSHDQDPRVTEALKLSQVEDFPRPVTSEGQKNQQGVKIISRGRSEEGQALQDSESSQSIGNSGSEQQTQSKTVCISPEKQESSELHLEQRSNSQADEEDNSFDEVLEQIQEAQLQQDLNSIDQPQRSSLNVSVEKDDSTIRNACNKNQEESLQFGNQHHSQIPSRHHLPPYPCSGYYEKANTSPFDQEDFDPQFLRRQRMREERSSPRGSSPIFRNGIPVLPSNASDQDIQSVPNRGNSDFSSRSVIRRSSTDSQGTCLLDHFRDQILQDQRDSQA